MEFKKPEPSNFTKEQVDLIGEKTAGHFNFGTDLSPDIESIVEKRFSGKVIYKPLYEILDSGTLIVKNGKPLIYVNSYDPYIRVRFTIAHELGHFILHSDFGKKQIKISRSEESNRLEWEANWFAAGFLMPRGIFIKKYNENSDELYLADYFKVSTSAVHYRIQFLKQLEVL